jgi:probable HAF family extracellular repeat protein
VAPTRYRVINLGSGDLSELPVINSKGQVSFSMQSDAGSRGYFYDGTVTTDIGTLGGPGTNAVDLNDAGQVAGHSTLPSGLEHAFVWRSGSGMVDLGVVPGASASAGAAINNRGVVAGTFWGSLTPPHAFRWSAASGIEDLGAFTAGIASFSSASLINDAGLIAGNSDTPAMNRAGFVWTRASGLIDISGPGGGDAYPYALGPKDQVAGAFSGPANGYLYHAFVWTRAGGMLDLGTAGGTESFVLAMNPRMQAAGVIDFGTDRQHAMAWTRTGGMRDLGTFGGLQSRAIDINGKGQIVGSADNASGDSRAFLWSASQGMIDLNTRLRDAPAGLALDDALAINDKGAIVATSNAGLVLLEPDDGGTGTYALGPIAAADMVKVGRRWPYRSASAMRAGARRAALPGHGGTAAPAPAVPPPATATLRRASIRCGPRSSTLPDAAPRSAARWSSTIRPAAWWRAAAASFRRRARSGGRRAVPPGRRSASCPAPGRGCISIFPG